jgi:hypothetical protein
MECTTLLDLLEHLFILALLTEERQRFHAAAVPPTRAARVSTRRCSSGWSAVSMRRRARSVVKAAFAES